MRKADIEWLPLRALQPHPIVQRGLIKARVKHLKAEFNTDKLDILIVWLNEGQYWIVDGQHRWHAAMDLGHGDTKVQCKVHRNANLEEMADIFLARNDTRQVTKIDQFPLGLLAGKPAFVAVDQIVKKHGLTVGAGTVNGRVQSVDKLFALHAKGPELLDDVLSVVVGAWGTRSAAVEGTILAGVGAVLANYNGSLDRSSLVQRLAKYKGGPAGLLGNARGLSGIKPISVTRAVAEITVDAYNNRRTSGKLPPL